MPMFIPGSTCCSLCGLILAESDDLVGISPCRPESDVEAAALLVPDDYLENRKTERKRLREESERRVELQGIEIYEWIPGWQQHHDEFEEEYVTEGYPPTTKEDALWNICDSLFHRECFEASSLRGAIAFLRGESNVFRVGMGGAITKDSGEMVLTAEQIGAIIEENKPNG